MKRVLILMVMVLFLVGFVSATDYYVDKDSIGGTCSDSNPGTITQPWCTISKASYDLQAGDTAHIRAGTYQEGYGNYGFYLQSGNGNQDNPIIFQAYKGDPQYSSIIDTRNTGVYLDNKSYVVIDGIYFNKINVNHGVYILDSNHITIQNCKFYNIPGNSIKITELNGESFDIAIINNEFPDAWVDFLTEENSRPWTHIASYYVDRLTMINNIIGKTTDKGIYLVENEDILIRNNTMNNEWHSAIVNNGGDEVESRALIENNRIKNCGEYYFENSPESTRWNQPGIQLVAQKNILRNNIITNCGTGIGFSAYNSLGKTRRPDYSHIYFNTLYENYRNIFHTGNYNPPTTVLDYNDVVVKNNIINNAQEAEWWNSADYPDSQGGSTENYFINNAFTPGVNTLYFKNTASNPKTLSQVKSLYPIEWYSSNFEADPLFADASNNDFTLQPGSPMINAGTWLTKITSPTVSSQTSFTIDDAGYFYDGWGIPGETGDTIKTENNQITIIQSINYDTNTITVSPAINIINGEGLALDYEGAAPDIGAYEYVGEIISTCGDADSDFSGFVSITELINYITGWKAGNVNINDLINGITEWKNGC